MLAEIDVPMAMTTVAPGVRLATAGANPSHFHFTKLWFDSRGYMTAFSARDPSIGLNIDPSNVLFQNLTTVDGLDYYRNIMGRARPHLGDVDGVHGVDLADAISAMRILSGDPLSPGDINEADVDGDGRIGMPEVIYILQRLSGFR